MRLALLLAALALPAAAEAPKPFLLTFTDPSNSHFARESLPGDVPAAVRKLLGDHADLAPVGTGPEVDSVRAAHDYAAREQARFYLFAQCGIVIELLKQCDAHIKYCAHQCEAWLYETGSNRQLGRARVTGEKGGSDAI